MKRAVRQIALLALALIVFCVLCRLTLFRTYTSYVPVLPGTEDMLKDGGPRAESGQPLVASPGEVRADLDYISVPIRAHGPGEAEVRVYSNQGDEIAYQVFRVGPMGTVYDEQTAGFTGDTAVLIAVTVFFLAVSAIMLWNYFTAKGPAYYAYSTIYFAGFSLFALVTGLLMLRVTVSHLIRPEGFTMMAAYSTISGASLRFMMLTLPLMTVFAAAMTVSNAALLRHERPRPRNVLGIAVSLLLIAGEALGVYMFRRDFSGSEWQLRVQSTFENVYATVFVYFECMLAGSVICGVTAARHRPAMDKDFIIILGCWFRRDGTLPPLLRGRVDRAVSFWREQKEKTGREAVLIPSGGQGRDEPMPEGEAMRRYLLEQDIPGDKIRPELRAANTYQNMAFSREIIEDMDPGGKTVFATTNYHVFRSGVWAANVGLEAEGIGGKTRWWYWPNAFMRECLGLLQRRWKQELLLLALLIAYFSVLTMVLG